MLKNMLTTFEAEIFKVLRLPYSLKHVKLSKLSFPWNKIGRKKSFKTIKEIFRYLSPEVEFWWAGGGFLYLQMRFSQNNFHHELLPHRRFQLSQFCIYGHKISQGSSIMTDNLKCAGIFRKSVYFFL